MMRESRSRRAGWVRPGRALLCLGLVAVLGMAGCGKKQSDEEAAAPPPGKIALDADSQEVAKKIQANMKDFLITNKVPATAKVTLNYVRKATFEGLYEASFSIEMGGQRGQRNFYFDRNAEHFVFGPVYTVGKVLRSRIDTRNMVLIDRAAKGPEAAPVVIAEYSDFQCPYCSAAAGTVSALLKKYNGRIRLVFKHMPLSDMHPWAYDAALTAECASVQKPEAFWYFHDYFFDPSKRLTRDNFKQKTEDFAKTINLDVPKLSACVAKRDPKTRIDYDLREANNYGFSATPTFVINDVVVVGNQPLSVFEEVIQEELQKAGKTKG